jgi:hypothetical protein
MPLRLARWFEARLHETLTVPTSSARLYGLELIDPEQLDELAPTAVRVAFLAEAPDESTLFEHDDAFRVADFDAGAIVEHRWLSVPAPTVRPGVFGGRRRARVVTVVMVDGSALVARFDDDPDTVVCSPAA